MKIPFNIKYKPQIESGEYKVVTREGVPIRIICFDAPIRNYPIIGITDDPNDDPFTFTIDGRYVFEPANPDSLDLFIITSEAELTEFEQGIRDMIINVFTTTHSVSDVMDYNTTHLLAAGLLELAKKEICKGCTVGLDRYWKGYEGAKERFEKLKTFYYPTYEPPCFHGGVCTNPMKDCINCPRTGGDIGISTTSGTCKKD